MYSFDCRLSLAVRTVNRVSGPFTGGFKTPADLIVEDEIPEVFGKIGYSVHAYSLVRVFTGVGSFRQKFQLVAYLLQRSGAGLVDTVLSDGCGRRTRINASVA